MPFRVRASCLLAECDGVKRSRGRGRNVKIGKEVPDGEEVMNTTVRKNVPNDQPDQAN